MPEEEQIKKRLLEIKQMRDNPDLFKLENTKVVIVKIIYHFKILLELQI